MPIEVHGYYSTHRDQLLLRHTGIHAVPTFAAVAIYRGCMAGVTWMCGRSCTPMMARTALGRYRPCVWGYGACQLRCTITQGHGNSKAG